MSRAPFQLRVIATNDVYFEGKAKSIVFPGLDGYLGVLPGHAPMIAAIGAGPLKIVSEDGQEQYFFVADGFARVGKDEVSVVCNATSRPGEIDLDRSRRSAVRARERLQARGEDPALDVARAEMALRRALQREKFASRWN